jgi:hypothetical protein
MPHSTSMAPSRTTTPLGAHSSMMNSASRPPFMSLTTSTTAPHATDLSKASVLQGAGAAKPSSSIVPTGRTSDIKCHCCHGIGHFQGDCPSKKSYIAIADGGYVSASDTEDDLALQSRHAGDLADDDDDEQVFGSEQMAEYSTKTYVMQRVLSAHVEQSEKLQRHNLFQIFFVINDCRIRAIIDGGSCNNLVNADFVTKIGLLTHAHTHPYYIQWLNNSGKAKVTHTACVHFSIGTYHDYADCDVVPMQACSLLLGHPWEFDTDDVHHGRANKYTLMHKAKKITLLLLTPNEIVQCDRAIAETAKCESEIQHDQTAPPSSSNAIKLKSHTILFIPTTIDAPFHALVCRQLLFSLDHITTPLPHTITNLLQEFKNIFRAETPPGLPPLRGIEHQIDLIPGVTLPNRAAYRTNPEETKEIQ